MFRSGVYDQHKEKWQHLRVNESLDDKTPRAELPCTFDSIKVHTGYR